MRAGVKEGVKELGRPLSVKEVSMAANVLRHSAHRHLLFFHHAAHWIVEGSPEIVQGDGESDNNQRIECLEKQQRSERREKQERSERTEEQERSKRTASLNEREERESDSESEESPRSSATRNPTRNPSHASSSRLVARQAPSSEASTSASATASTTAAGSSGCSEAESVSMCQSVSMLLHALTAPGLLPQVIHTTMLLVYQALSY
jgi:hypothetical protein